MMVEQALDMYMKNTTELTDLVGERIHFVKAPQGETFPYIVFFAVSDPPFHDIPARRPRFQISIWSKNKYEALKIKDVVSRMLQRYKGKMGGSGGVRVKQGVELDSPVFYERNTHSYHIPVDFKIIYLEA